MKILVTGGAGYIGSVVTDTLIDHGHDVVVLDNLSKGTEGAVNGAAKLIEGDIRTYGDVCAAIHTEEPEAVIHLAAEAQISDKDPRAFFDVNVAGGLNILNAMASFKVDKLVFASSAAVYGEPDVNKVDERYPTFACNAYGESKIMFEQMAFWYKAAYGIKFAGLRLFNVAGATPGRGENRPEETHIIPILLDCARNKRPFTLLGTDYETHDGTCLRDYVHVRDVASAFLLCLDKIDVIKDRCFNVCRGMGDSNQEVIDLVRRITGIDVQVDRMEKRPGDPARLIGDPRKLIALGWKPTAALAHIIQDAWAWNDLLTTRATL